MAANTSSQEQRLQAALARRLAVAKAEALGTQPEKSKTERNTIGSSSPSSSAAIAASTSLRNPSKKGLSLAHPAASQDVEESGLAYAQLPQSIHENLLTADVKFQDKKGATVNKIVHELLQHGDSAQKYIGGSRSMKIDNWILLDNLVQDRGKSNSAYTRVLKANSKRSKTHMSMKKLKKCGSFDLPQHHRKYDYFKPMHEMWKGYIMQLCKITGENQLAQSLFTADLHGALMTVADCKVTSFVGITGFMIRETAETFGIITQDNKFRDCWPEGLEYQSKALIFDHNRLLGKPRRSLRLKSWSPKSLFLSSHLGLPYAGLFIITH